MHTDTYATNPALRPTVLAHEALKTKHVPMPGPEGAQRPTQDAARERSAKAA